MQIEPAPAAFAEAYAAGRPQVVWSTLVADLETPVSAFLKVASRRRPSARATSAASVFPRLVSSAAIIA